MTTEDMQVVVGGVVRTMSAESATRAALGAGAPSEISNAEAVDISYPGFFHILRNLSQT